MINAYVELEALLDMEMAVAVKLDPDAIKKWGNKWHGRPYNLRPQEQAGVNYTYEEFKAAWDNRDESIFAHCIPTRLMWQLCYVVADYCRSRQVGFVTPSIKLTVNTYPFDFTDDAAKALHDAVRQFMGEGDEVELINRHPATLNPAEIRATWTVMFFYDFKRWHESNQMLLEDNPINNVLVVARRISDSVPPAEIPLLEMYEAIEKSNAPVMFMRFFGIHWFSYYFPPGSQGRPSDPVPPRSPEPTVEPF